MSNLAKPIIHRIRDDLDDLEVLENELSERNDYRAKIIKDFPTVYIHNLEKSGKFDVYVGESNDIFKRTRQHFDAAKDSSTWQSEFQKNEAYLYIIGHDHFNKSLTLDIENRLMHYMMSVDQVRRVYNSRGNPQASYYPMEELDDIFSSIWSSLRRYDKNLFPSEAELKDSAIFKASPLHKLTAEQKRARDLIIDKVNTALEIGQRNQLIFIEGEAGTGKTVLNSSTFYELYCEAEEKEKSLNSFLLVNHNEQITVYKQIAEKLGLIKKYGNIIEKPTSFINNHSIENPVDVVFIDEGHLLLTQGKQSYRGNNQLQDIIERSRVTVVMFDENQILTTEQFWEAVEIEKIRRKAIKSNNYIELKKQLRMHADPLTMDWIDAFTKNNILKPIPLSKNYTIQVFDNPEDMEKEILKKASIPDSDLSRIVATYDWDYSSLHRPENDETKKWEVKIGNWHMPWNYELEKDFSKQEKQSIKNLAWAEQPQTIGEVGSTFTIQGFDLNYCGVILGPSVKYRNGRIVFDPKESSNQKAIRNRTLSDGSKQSFGELLLQHEVRVLMTRGVNGMYIYACDPELRNALKQALK